VMKTETKPLKQHENFKASGSGDTSTQPTTDSDAKSDVSFDPLFDDEPETPNVPPPPTAVNPPPVVTRPPVSQAPPPKNMPPLLDSSRFATYSADLVMTASIDGQVMLWDRRVNSPGTGVGRLWMSEKTPPWCLSVRHCPFKTRSYLS
jgi:transcriptional activator SPT8